MLITAVGHNHEHADEEMACDGNHDHGHAHGHDHKDEGKACDGNHDHGHAHGHDHKESHSHSGEHKVSKQMKING